MTAPPSPPAPSVSWLGVPRWLWRLIVPACVVCVVSLGALAATAWTVVELARVDAARAATTAPPPLVSTPPVTTPPVITTPPRTPPALDNLPDGLALCPSSLNAEAIAQHPAPFRCVCSPWATDLTRSVWGDGVYTSDSGVCTAAIHAGVLKLGEVGPVALVVEPGRESYPSAMRNGVASHSWGSWAFSFRFVADPGSNDAQAR